MTINKTSGQTLSFQNDIEAEFGSTPTRSLGSYRSSDSNFQNKNVGSLSNLPLDFGIPTSGEIKFSDFYGKKLNVVVDYFSGGTEVKQTVGANTMSATWRYDNQSGKVTVVGGFRTRPALNAWQGGKRILINVNKTLGGNKDGDASDVALRTGVWPSGTELQVEIGTNGKILGAGGNGGAASPALTSSNGLAGGNGTSALGVEYPATINNNGILRCGFAGGGGGSGGAADPNDSHIDFGRSGGGGGGGAGLPAGAGGANGTGSFSVYNSGAHNPALDGAPGAAGTEDSGGNGGAAQQFAYPAGTQHELRYWNQDLVPCTLTSASQITATTYCGLVLRAGGGGNGGDGNDAATAGATAFNPKPGLYAGAGVGGQAGTNGSAIYYTNNTVQNGSTLIGGVVGGIQVGAIN